MNHVLKNNFFYFFLVLAGATAVPLMAHAEGPDSGDGPEITTMKADESAPVVDEEAGDTAAPKKKKDAPAKAIAPDNYGYAGGNVGGSSAQGFTVGPSLGYNGDHEGASVSANLGAGGKSVFGADVSIMGMRTNGNTPGGVTVAGLANGSANIGTSGQGTANGVGAAAVIVPFTASKDISCMLGVGPAAGGMYSNQIAPKNADGSNGTTEIAGPGGYLGFGCQGSFWKADLYNHAIVNSLHWSGDPTKPSIVGMQSKAVVTFRVNDSMSVGAWAQMDGDFRDNKLVPDESKFGASFAGGGMLSGTFGDSGRKKSAK